MTSFIVPPFKIINQIYNNIQFIDIHDRFSFCTFSFYKTYTDTNRHKQVGCGMMKISELQTKDVVNIMDGKKLGKIQDLDIDLRQGMIKAIIVPNGARLWGWMNGGQEWVIPWRQIIKIGSDVIFVRLTSHHREMESSYYLPYESDDTLR